MDSTFNMDQAKELLERSGQEAQELLQDPSKIRELLQELPEKLQAIPGVGDFLKDIPLTVALVKSFAAGEYRDVSPQIILPVIGAFAYLVKKKDLIRDDIPVLGFADDLAVLGLALKAIEPELKAFEAWQKGEGSAQNTAAADFGGGEEAQEGFQTEEPQEELQENGLQAEFREDEPQDGFREEDPDEAEPDEDPETDENMEIL